MKKLTDEQKSMIRNALQYVYDTKIKQIRINRKLLSVSERESILKSANDYYDLSEKFN